MKQNILYIPQFSMSDGEKLFIDKDGNFLVLKTMIKHLRDFCLDKGFIDQINITCLIPEVGSYSQDVFFTELTELVDSTDNIDITYRHHPFNISPIKNRYDFDMDEWKYRLLEKHHITAIFNNIPEITRNLRALLGNRKIPIISLHHFCDYIQENKLVTNWENGNLFSYFWRQFDGWLSSDYNIFNCLESQLGWHEALVSTFFDGKTITALIESIVAKKECDKVTTYTDLMDYRTGKQTVATFPETTAVFSARITDSLYTNWTRAVDLFNNSKTKGRIILTNPSGSKGLAALSKYLRQDIEKTWTKQQLLISNDRVTCLVDPREKIWVVSELITRDQYLKICNRAHLAINFYKNERYGGIAIRETVASGHLFPVVPNIYSFEKWLKDLDDKYKFESITDLTPGLYNELCSLLNSKEHRKIIDNFYCCEDYDAYNGNDFAVKTIFEELFLTDEK